MKVWDRLKKNLKLTWESVIVIELELRKLVVYWIIIGTDTKLIYERFKKEVSKFKELLWKK